MEEIWKDIPNYEGYYQVSNLGRVRSLPRETNNQYACGRIMALQVNRGGYCYVDLTNNSARKRYNVHRLVAKSFIPNQLNKPCINHIDGNKSNNNVNNLEWCTHSENTQHALRTGLLKIEFTKEQIENIAKRNRERCSKPIIQMKDNKIINTFPSQCEASRVTGIRQCNISAAARTNIKAGGFNWAFKK